jgi:diguanylate cyclase (GGDEF)-like protein
VTASSGHVRVLLIEDDLGDALLIRESLAESKVTIFELVEARRLAEGLSYLDRDEADLVLLDLALPDSLGMRTFETLRGHAPSVPVIVLSGLDDEEVAVEAVNRGAQEYLVKGDVSGPLLARSIRHAIERHGLQEQLRGLATRDELTGLNNRRGFTSLAEHELKRASRAGRRVVVLFIDLDRMKTINDTLGHAEGDRALRAAADILSSTFRDSDIVGRVGGDEFCVMLCSEADDDGAVTKARLAEAVEAYNRTSEAGFELSFSVGSETHDATEAASLDEILERADRRMYEHKRGKDLRALLTDETAGAR